MNKFSLEKSQRKLTRKVTSYSIATNKASKITGIKKSSYCFARTREKSLDPSPKGKFLSHSNPPRLQISNRPASRETKQVTIRQLLMKPTDCIQSL
jgi:hypothetical protein